MTNLNIAGKIKGSGTLKGRLDKPEVKVDLSANNLAYKNIKQGADTLFLKGQIALDKGALQLKDLMLKTGNNELSASGQASEPFNLNWKIKANNLKQLSPLIAGRVNGSGQLKGTIKKPEIKVNLSANNLAYKDIKQGKETFKLEGELGLDNEIIHLKNLTAKSGSNLIT
ncbi:MAG TPA: hypothetical protein EYP09_10800, partial [Anaerolineae bacterium]|nr:hypothetical protein [Anaerolineae bacterium]